MPTYHFTVVLQGNGDDANEAWYDAIKGFVLEPGPTPYNFELIEDETEGDFKK